jgi:hypothetical protein
MAAKTSTLRIQDTKAIRLPLHVGTGKSLNLLKNRSALTIFKSIDYIVSQMINRFA